MEINIDPLPPEGLARLELMERGEERSRHAKAIVAHIPATVGRRELAALSKRVSWPTHALEVELAHHAKGPGNAIVAEIEYEHVTASFVNFGARGVRAEQVGRDVGQRVREYLVSTAPVEEYLADQLLLPMALGGGGRLRCTTVSSHTRTNLEMLRQGLEIETTTEDAGPDGHVLEVGLRAAAGSATPLSA